MIASTSPTKGIYLFEFFFFFFYKQFYSLEQMDTSNTDVEPTTTEETPVNGMEESSTETKGGKRKRSTKKQIETDEANISNGRPRRTLPKRK
jgi:hypothetical protein